MRDGSSRCPKHLVVLKADLAKRAALHDKERGTAHERGYSSRWRKARATWLLRHPLCVECERRGLVTAASVVDHIVPHRGSSALFWDTANWQPLCQRCHDSIKQREEHAATRGGRNPWR